MPELANVCEGGGSVRVRGEGPPRQKDRQAERNTGRQTEDRKSVV